MIESDSIGGGCMCVCVTFDWIRAPFVYIVYRPMRVTQRKKLTTNYNIYYLYVSASGVIIHTCPINATAKYVYRKKKKNVIMFFVHKICLNIKKKTI